MSESILSTQAAEWDAYWRKKNRGGLIYSLIAEFYRKVIIRPTLNHFIRKYYKPGSLLLHAGCGSGQVDRDICREYDIMGMDISPEALVIYKLTNDRGNDRGRTLLSSIFSIQLPNQSVDGVYNLGVMEHLTVDEIQTSLLEFKRILKPKGRIVLFWPPEFGLSVLFFKFLIKATKLISGKDVKFHPDEISRIQSKNEAKTFLEKAGFKMLEYSFGPRDLFTYSILVGEPA